MDWTTYQNLFKTILDNPTGDYLDDHIYQYTKMNEVRTNRWLRKFELDEATIGMLNNINTPQNWELITEPWCGDAAHITPIIYKMASSSDKIQLNIQLRDTDSEIEKYLTNGSKSIPILIVRKVDGTEMFHWGPRPSGAAALFQQLKSENVEFEVIKEELQKWYNANKGKEIEKEISQLLQQYHI